MNKRFDRRSNLRILAIEYHLAVVEAPIEASNYHELRGLLWSWSS